MIRAMEEVQYCMGDIISTLEGVHNGEGYHNNSGGFSVLWSDIKCWIHKYIGRFLVPLGVVVSTVRFFQY